MGIDPHRMASSDFEVVDRQRELLRSLRAAVDTLTVCVERIEDLIERADRQVSADPETPARHQPAQVSFGGGSSVIGSSPSRGVLDEVTGADDRRRGLERRTDRADRADRRLDTERRMPRRGESGDPGTPALMAATEMAHLGYSREEIAERLRARWGDRAAAILREALD